MKKLILILIMSIIYSCSLETIDTLKEESTLNKKSSTKKFVSLYKWMEDIPDNTNITKITIPGTHDSGARYDFLFPNTSKTQNLTIDEQLNVGIRFLDIRCKISSNRFAIYHGIVWQHLMFDDIIDSIKLFLATHPSECIILSVKKEDGNDSSIEFENIFRDYLEEELGNIIYQTNNTAFPNLGEARGKIILLKRFAGIPEIGYNAYSGWLNNHQGSFSINNNQYMLNIQDYFDIGSLNTKWELVQNHFLQASLSNTNSSIYLNFFSGLKKNFIGLPNIKVVSDFINPKVKNYFTSLQEKKSYGICIIDFASEEYTKPIVDVNFN